MSAAVLLALLAAQAPAATQIDADVAPALSLGTTVTPAGTAYVVDGGTRAGNNLFHSFSRFDLAAGDTARWAHTSGDPATVANVVNRVTGGTPSSIFGTIDSTALPNADFWFINPAGIVFGETARLDVPAAAHFSTGRELRFAEGPVFAVTTPGGSTFSVAAPAAFGFLGGEGAIAAAGLGPDFLPPGGRLILAGSDLTIRDSNLAGRGFKLFAAGGDGATILLADAVANRLSGSLLIDSSVLRLDGAGPEGTEGIRIVGGDVVLNFTDLGTAFVAGPDAGVSGPIEIAGDQVSIFASLISTTTYGAEPAGGIGISGHRVEIGGNSVIASDTRAGSTGTAGLMAVLGEEIIVTERSRISSSTQTAQSGGGILLQGGRIRLDGGAVIATDSLSGATGNAGGILLLGQSLDIADAAALTSSTEGSGNAGAIVIDIEGAVTLSRGLILSRADPGSTGTAGLVTVEADSLSLRDAASISTATSGAGAGGLIAIHANHVLLDGVSRIESESDEDATGNAGTILIGPGASLTVTGDSLIRSDTSGTGRGGNISIEMDEIELSGGGSISSDSRIECTAFPCAQGGDAGDISIVGRRLTILGPIGEDLAPSRAISSDSFASGDAGRIDIRVDLFEMDGLAFVSSDTTGAGNGGLISIAAADVAMRNGGFISTTSFGTGHGGSVRIEAARLLVENDAAIFSQSHFAGNGGTITVNAGTATIRNAEINSSGLGSGNAGAIEMSGGRLVVDGGAILSDTQGAGAGGDIRIAVSNVEMINGGMIAADSLGCFLLDCETLGRAGSVTITADSLVMRGVLDDDGARAASITSQTYTTGRAGDIVLRLGRLDMDLAVISSATAGPGDAGTIDISAADMRIGNISQIETSSMPFCPDGVCPSAGHAGSIVLSATGAIALSGFSTIFSNTYFDGDAGQIEIAADRLALDQSTIATNAEEGSLGRSGNVGIAVRDLVVTNGSRIATQSANALPAGLLGIAADRIRLENTSVIASGNDYGPGGDAGSMLIAARELSLVEGGIISTSSVAGAAGNIVILMPRNGLIWMTGRVFDNAITTSSGPGTGGRIIISNPYAIVSDGGAILALGEQGGANVLIATDYFIRSADRTNRVAVDGDFLLEAQVGDVSTGTVERDLSILDASGVLRGQCAAARATGQASQLVVRPVGPYAPAMARPASGSCL